MPLPSIDPTAALLRLGVGGTANPSVIMPFDIGGIGVIENVQPFDIEAAWVGITNWEPFDIEGAAGIESVQPFDIGTVAYTTSTQPFDILSADLNPVTGVPMPAPVVAESTTVAVGAPAGSTSVVVTSVAGISAGTTITVNFDIQTSYLVTAVLGTTLTLASPTLFAYPAGSVVVVLAVNTVMTAPASAGDTSITVLSAAGVTTTMMVGVTDPATGTTEYRTVASVSGSALTLIAPLGMSYPSGSGVMQSLSFLPGMLVCDKSGLILGAIQDFAVNASRSHSIGEPGSMTFYMPRNSPDIALVASDRVVAMGNTSGLPLWLGSVTTQAWTGSTGNIHVEDAFSLLTGTPIELKMEVLDDTPAWAVYQAVIDMVNARRGKDGEVQWTTDLSGTKPFLGDFDFHGDPDQALRTIADRSGTEYAWSAHIAGGHVVPTLVVRDKFSAPAGVPLTDGPGGNVSASPTYQVDPTTIINGLRLTGATTTVKAFVDDWADWAVHEVEPTIEVYADTGPYRRRIDLDFNVDFSLSRRQQQYLARRTSDEVWAMYERYCYAVHDIWGRPNHEGFVYEGPPADLEPELHLPDWHAHAELALFRGNRPIALVMKGVDEWVGVIYDTIKEKLVEKFAFGSVFRPNVAYIDVRPGVHTIWDESGGRCQPYTVYSNATVETWTVDMSTITALDGNLFRRTLRNIRVAGSHPFTGRYIDMGDTGYVNLRQVSAVTNVEDRGSQIGRIWDMEKVKVRDWDPRRDGIGSLLTRKTVYDSQATTRARWHIVPYSTGEEAETRLAQGVVTYDMPAGLARYADLIYVESCQSFPIDHLPFDILVGDPLESQEIMQVYRAFGNQWSVWRGQTAQGVTTTAPLGAGATVVPVTGTTVFVTSMNVIVGNKETKVVSAIDAVGLTITLATPLVYAYPSGTTVTTSGLISGHLAGSIVRLLGGKPFDGFVYPYDWTEGREYANNLLERLRRPSRMLSVVVTNENDDWSTFQFGSTHAIDVQTEGPPGGVVGTVRCLGMSPMEADGTMEVLVEVVDGP